MRRRAPLLSVDAGVSALGGRSESAGPDELNSPQRLLCTTATEEEARLVSPWAAPCFDP